MPQLLLLFALSLLGRQPLPLDLLEGRRELLLLDPLGQGRRGCGGGGGDVSLQLLREKELRVPRLLVMDAALGLLLALPAAGALVLAGGDGRRRVPVPDGLVAPVQQGVVRHVVLGDVRLDLGERPVEQRVDLDDAPLVVDLEDGDLVALAALAAAPAREDGGHAQLGVGALLRLHLGEPVVQLRRRGVQLGAVLRLELGGRRGPVGLVHVQLDGRVPLPDARDEGVRLGEVVQRVQEDGVDAGERGVRGRELREHVDRDETREPEGRRLVQVREQVHGEPQTLDRRHLLHLLVEVPQVRLRERDLREARCRARCREGRGR